MQRGNEAEFGGFAGKFADFRETKPNEEYPLITRIGGRSESAVAAEAMAGQAERSEVFESKEFFEMQCGFN
jgi:hypothetical protein